jgi:hypothetical protein
MAEEGEEGVGVWNQGGQLTSQDVYLLSSFSSSWEWRVVAVKMGLIMGLPCPWMPWMLGMQFIPAGANVISVSIATTSPFASIVAPFQSSISPSQLAISLYVLSMLAIFVFAPSIISTFAFAHSQPSLFPSSAFPAPPFLSQVLPNAVVLTVPSFVSLPAPIVIVQLAVLFMLPSGCAALIN